MLRHNDTQKIKFCVWIPGVSVDRSRDHMDRLYLILFVIPLGSTSAKENHHQVAAPDIFKPLTSLNPRILKRHSLKPQKLSRRHFCNHQSSRKSKFKSHTYRRSGQKPYSFISFWQKEKTHIDIRQVFINTFFEKQLRRS